MGVSPIPVTAITRPPSVRRSSYGERLLAADSPERGLEITGIEEARASEGVSVFTAGVAKRSGESAVSMRSPYEDLATDGGRVIAVTGMGDTPIDASRRAYRGVELIHFDGLQYRRDIGF